MRGHQVIQPHNKNKEKIMPNSLNSKSQYLQNPSLKSIRFSRKHHNRYYQNIPQNYKEDELIRIRKMQDAVNNEMSDSVWTEFFKELFGKKSIIQNSSNCKLT